MVTRGGPAKIARLSAFGLFLIGYLLAVALSERAYGSLAVPSPFWLPDSVLLTTLLLVPQARWWIFPAAVWPVRLLVGAPAGTPLWYLVVSVGNDMLKALGTAWTLERIVGRPVRLDKLTDFWTFLAVAGAGAPLLSAVAAAPAGAALGRPMWSGFVQWFLGDALAQVVVTPMLLLWATRGYRQASGRVGELVLLMIFLATALGGALVLGEYAHPEMLLYVPVPFLIWAAVRLRPFGTTNGIALVGFVFMVGTVDGIGAFAHAAPAQSVLSLQLFLLVFAVPLLSLAVLMTERERLQLRESGFNRRLLEAQDRERARIARDLHDDLGQRMAVLQMSLETVGRREGYDRSPESRLQELAKITAEMSLDLRQLSHRLHPSTLDAVGLESALRSLCRDFDAQHGLRVELRCGDLPPQLEPDVRLCLFRVAQEALQNVAQHSRAVRATVELAYEAERLVLCITDAGEGFDARNGYYQPGLGLTSMLERLRLIGGRLSIQSVPGVGTRVRAEVQRTEASGRSTRLPA